MRPHRLLIALGLLGLLLAGPGLAAPAARVGAAPGESCFAETGQCIRGRFLDYWLANGGLARNGFPLSDERREVLEDGVEYTVQYFERVRLELYPENAPPYDVLLGQFGRRVYGLMVADPLPAIDEQFRGYWEANGGLAQFGYALTPAFPQQLEGGNTYTVQYFERARFEAHPENQPPYDILLGQFGRQILTENEAVAAPFRRLFVAGYQLPNGQQARAYRAPAGPWVVTQAAYQPFERGALLWRADTLQILLVENPLSSGSRGLCSTLPGDMGPGEAPSNLPGPAPGLYEPRGRFGQLWRDESTGVRARLGYATTPDEVGYLLTAQPFLSTQPITVTLLTRPGEATAYDRYREGCLIVPLR